jgi:hypothetical protein
VSGFSRTNAHSINVIELDQDPARADIQQIRPGREPRREVVVPAEVGQSHIA